MLFSKSRALPAFQLASLGTVPEPVKPMYRTSLPPWPLSPVMPSLGKHSLASAMDASPMVLAPLVSPQMP